jgi:hypothetical protein
MNYKRRFDMNHVVIFMLLFAFITALLLAALPLSFAQFHFFDNMWGHPQQQQQQQRYHPSGASQWAAYSEGGMSKFCHIPLELVLKKYFFEPNA